MRERQAPAITALPFELVGEEGHGQPRAAQDRADDTIEAVRDDLHLGAVPTAELEKGREAGVDAHGADLLVERLGRRAQQRNLARPCIRARKFVRLAKLPRSPATPGRRSVRADGPWDRPERRCRRSRPEHASLEFVCLACFDGSNRCRLGASDVERLGSREKPGVAIGRNPVCLHATWLPNLRRPPSRLLILS